MDILSIHYCDMQYMYMIQNFVSIIILYKYSIELGCYPNVRPN